MHASELPWQKNSGSHFEMLNYLSLYSPLVQAILRLIYAIFLYISMPVGAVQI